MMKTLARELSVPRMYQRDLIDTLETLFFAEYVVHTLALHHNYLFNEGRYIFGDELYDSVVPFIMQEHGMGEFDSL